MPNILITGKTIEAQISEGRLSEDVSAGDRLSSDDDATTWRVFRARDARAMGPDALALRDGCAGETIPMMRQGSGVVQVCAPTFPSLDLLEHEPEGCEGATPQGGPMDIIGEVTEDGHVILNISPI